MNKLIFIFIILLSGCGYTISHQFVMTPEDKIVNQNTINTKK